MSGNGAQGTKFRISVCTEDNIVNNKWNKKESQRKINHYEQQNNSDIIKIHQRNKVNKGHIKLNRISSIRSKNMNERINIKELETDKFNRDSMIKKQQQRINLSLQLRYMKLMKSNTIKKSYKPRKMNHLLKLCEIMNEEEIQEDKCFASGINKFRNKIQKKIYNKDIILCELISSKEEEKIEETHVHKMKKKAFDLDGTSKLFNTIKFVH